MKMERTRTGPRSGAAPSLPNANPDARLRVTALTFKLERGCRAVYSQDAGIGLRSHQMRFRVSKLGGHKSARFLSRLLIARFTDSPLNHDF
jgi:hypothetical protein